MSMGVLFIMVVEKKSALKVFNFLTKGIDNESKTLVSGTGTIPLQIATKFRMIKSDQKWLIQCKKQLKIHRHLWKFPPNSQFDSV